MAKNAKVKENGGPASTTKLTAGATIIKLIKAKRALKEDLDALTTTNAEEIREAVSKKHLHKKAFNTIVMLDRLTPEKLADFMEHFDHYFEVSGLEERANSAQRLPMGDGAGEGASDEEKDEGENVGDKKGNVRNIAEGAGARLPN